MKLDGVDAESGSDIENGVGHEGMPPATPPSHVAPPAAPSHMMPPIVAPTLLPMPPGPMPVAPRTAALLCFPPAGPAIAALGDAAVGFAGRTRKSTLVDPHQATGGTPKTTSDRSAVAGVILATSAHAAILGCLARLARNIKQPRTTVGYSAFILFALVKKCRPIIWEGSCPMDLIERYAHLGSRALQTTLRGRRGGVCDGGAQFWASGNAPDHG
jgi:hypothetical protein